MATFNVRNVSVSSHFVVVVAVVAGLIFEYKSDASVLAALGWIPPMWPTFSPTFLGSCSDKHLPPGVKSVAAAPLISQHSP